jgi:hypothetical protein
MRSEAQMRVIAPVWGDANMQILRGKCADVAVENNDSKTMLQTWCNRQNRQNQRND